MVAVVGPMNVVQHDEDPVNGCVRWTTPTMEEARHSEAPRLSGGLTMKFIGFELRRVRLPLVSAFRTSFGVEHEREVLLVRAVGAEAEGWGECAAMTAPLYSSEYIDGAEHVMRSQLVPRLLAQGDLTAVDVASTLHAVQGHRMAKSALEMAVLDAELRHAGWPLGRYLGAVREQVDCGVSVGIEDDVPALLDAVSAHLEAGYRRIKLKIEPGWDVEPVAAVRKYFGQEISLQVDANGAYTSADARHLSRLDAFDLVLIEQPFPEEDLAGHVTLSRLLTTPICLDESIVSAASAADAIIRGACRIVNIKPGRVGGYLEARRIHDVCAAHGIPVWCGGMLETGLGRAANVALAALPNFRMPGDTSASGRYYAEDLTAPFELDDGRLAVPSEPGLGVEPIPSVLKAFTTSATYVQR
jgi:o-succinylbenzoate synthase